jgi:hypothetical protein
MDNRTDALLEYGATLKALRDEIDAALSETNLAASKVRLRTLCQRTIDATRGMDRAFLADIAFEARVRVRARRRAGRWDHAVHTCSDCCPDCGLHQGHTSTCAATGPMDRG